MIKTSCSFETRKYMKLPTSASKKEHLFSRTPPSAYFEKLVNLFINRNSRCVKCVRIRSYSGPYFPVFSPNAVKYGSNKLQIRTLFTQWHEKINFFYRATATEISTCQIQNLETKENINISGKEQVALMIKTFSDLINQMCIENSVKLLWWNYFSRNSPS